MIDVFRRDVQAARLGLWFVQLRQDVRHGVRALVKRPVFTVAAVLTLSLGTGATATVYTLLDTVLLRPLPVSQPSELAHVYTSCRLGDPYCSSSYPEFLDYRAESRAFTDMAAFSPVNVQIGEATDGWVGTAMLVSTSYFSLLGLAPFAGQLLSPAADPTDAVAVLDHGAWETRFGSDPGVIGSTLQVSGIPYRVAGVAPPGFRGTRLDMYPDLWLPIETAPQLPALSSALLENRGARWIRGTVGRLDAGVAMARAQADMVLVSDGLQATDPSRQLRFVTVEAAATAALPPDAAADVRRFLFLLMGAVVATLFIACANIVGLLLARGTARRHELELRRALGAGRGRLVRQLLAESLLLAAAGTLTGLVVARWALGVLTAYQLPGALSVAGFDLALDGRVLLFALILLVATTLVGLLPALAVTRRLDVDRPYRHSQRGQRVLLGLQTAVTVVLLLGAGLFIRSLQGGLALDLGLDDRGVVVAEVAPGLNGFTAERTRSALDASKARLEGLPAVTAAAAATVPPLSFGIGFLAQEIEGYERGTEEEIRFESNAVQPGYFRTLGIDVRAGRTFAASDREGAPLVAVVSETMARRYWAGRDAVGGRIISRSFDTPIEIVGVVRDVTVGLNRTAEPFVYLPLAQHPRFFSRPFPMVVLARTSSDPQALAGAVRRLLADVDASLPVSAVTTLEARVADLLMPQRLGSALLSALGLLTVVLVAVGITGTVAYGVARRRREIGIRLALGAQRLQIARTMARIALTPVAIGLAAGALGAVALGRLVASFLYGVQPTDGLTFAVVTGFVGLVAGVTAWVPARRAARIDPAEVLVSE